MTFLYVEHARVEQASGAIVLMDASGKTFVPVAALSTLLLGPGTSVTHAAMLAIADCGGSVVFCGGDGVRFYASGVGETRRTAGLLHQARVWADPKEHLEVVVRMYRMRFPGELDPSLTLEQVRGMEGVRVRESYARAAREADVEWTGRAYSGEWSASTPVNRALSSANACLYGLCHAAIVSVGLSPGLGFVHTGKALSFVYDVADLYKCELSVPVAFAASKGPLNTLEARVRTACRQAFREQKLLERIVPDMQRALGLRPDKVRLLEAVGEPAAEAPTELWDPEGPLSGGHNYAPASLDTAGEP